MPVDYFFYCMYEVHLTEREMYFAKREMYGDDEYEDDEKENE